MNDSQTMLRLTISNRFDWTNWGWPKNVQIFHYLLFSPFPENSKLIIDIGCLKYNHLITLRGMYDKFIFFKREWSSKPITAPRNWSMGMHLLHLISVKTVKTSHGQSWTCLSISGYDSNKSTAMLECQKVNSHSFIMPMSMQRLRRQAWQWRRLSLVMVQLPLNGQVKEALRFMLRLLD